MKQTKREFSLKEVEQLVKNAYEVGFYDGLEGGDSEEFREYKNSDDFWNKNVQHWLNEDINYIS